MKDNKNVIESKYDKIQNIIKKQKTLTKKNSSFILKSKFSEESTNNTLIKSLKINSFHMKPSNLTQTMYAEPNSAEDPYFSTNSPYIPFVKTSKSSSLPAQSGQSLQVHKEPLAIDNFFTQNYSESDEFGKTQHSFRILSSDDNTKFNHGNNVFETCKTEDALQKSASTFRKTSSEDNKYNNKINNDDDVINEYFKKKNLDVSRRRQTFEKFAFRTDDYADNYILQDLIMGKNVAKKAKMNISELWSSQLHRELMMASSMQKQRDALKYLTLEFMESSAVVQKTLRKGEINEKLINRVKKLDHDIIRNLMINENKGTNTLNKKIGLHSMSSDIKKKSFAIKKLNSPRIIPKISEKKWNSLNCQIQSIIDKTKKFSQPKFC